MDGTAVVVTDGHLADIYGKTAHGLIRGSERFRVVAVIDAQYSGRDAGEVLDGRPRGIPVFSSLADMFAMVEEIPEFCIIGCATHGGVIPPALRATLEGAIRAGLSIVNGLHESLSDDPVFRALAEEANVSIIDVRKPQKPLHFWTGEVLSVKAPRIAVLGTDCAVGKRTTMQLLREACLSHDIKAEMIHTGQTGWMQGMPHGFIFDVIPNDFVGGELEHAIVSTDRECSPDVIFLEGQGALVSEDIELIRLLGARTLALTLNDDGLTPNEIRAERDRLCRTLGLPVVIPLMEGVEALIPVIRQYIDEETTA